MPKKVVEKYYKTKKEAEDEAKRLNKLKGKKVYIVLKENGKYIVVNIIELL